VQDESSLPPEQVFEFEKVECQNPAESNRALLKALKALKALQLLPRAHRARINTLTAFDFFLKPNWFPRFVDSIFTM